MPATAVEVEPLKQLETALAIANEHVPTGTVITLSKRAAEAIYNEVIAMRSANWVVNGGPADG